MSIIGFVGLGNMGGPMSANLVMAGHRVRGFDLAGAVRQAAAERGVEVVGSVAAAADGADVFIMMLPNGAIVRDVLAGAGGALEKLPAGALVIDSSSIDVTTTRDMHAAAAEKGRACLITRDGNRTASWARSCRGTRRCNWRR
jgi:3-hydroxyisobutyrate dehydrogenase